MLMFEVVAIGLLLFCPGKSAASGPELSQFVWPNKWSAVQEVHLVSGKFKGATQMGRIEYDAVRNWTREDQTLISGPSVKTPVTSDNMTEWFRGLDWFYMDWTTMKCWHNNFGFGQVRPDFLVNAAFKHITGSTWIYTYEHETSNRRDYVNTSYIHTDGSPGFGEPPGSSLFEYYVDSAGKGRRLRMPSTLSSDLVIELKGFKSDVTTAIDDLPASCKDPNLVKKWTWGPVTPLALRASMFQ